jgi:hypothetical protein
MQSKKILIVLLLLSALSAASCGYHLSGSGGIVPEGMKTLAVPVFFNGTREPYIDVEVTQAVVEEFMTDGRLRIVSLEEANLALRGRIIRYEVIPLSYNPQSFVQQYRVRIVIEAALEDLRSRKILWKEQGIESNFISDYAVAYPVDPEDNLVRDTRVAKDAAIKKASQDIAWTVRSRVLEGF